MVLDSDSKARDGQNEGGTITLGPRDSLEGKLVCQGDLRVQGTVEGELEVRGDFLVDNDAVVRAPVAATNVTVRGTLEGDVTARGRLFVGGSGSVTGSARVRRLAVEDGATVNGSLTMDTQATGAADRPSGSDRGADGNSSGSDRTTAAERRVGSVTSERAVGERRPAAPSERSSTSSASPSSERRVGPATTGWAPRPVEKSPAQEKAD